MTSIRESILRKAFHVANAVFMLMMIVVTLYPILYVLFASFSRENRLIAHQGLLLGPLGFNTEAYKAVFKNPMIWSSYINTVYITFFGVAMNVLLTSIGAYVLSRKNVLWGKPVMMFIVFTMYFSGGLIPFYFTVKEMGLDGTRWALIIPTAVNAFNLIILRTGFAAIPVSLEESARIDGANDYTILFRIIMPLSLPVLSVITLYYMVGHWNAWFNAMLFVRDRKLYPLQLLLREILIQEDTNSMTVFTDKQKAFGETIKYAVIIVSTLPILCLYPFLQKYFVKGVMIGAIKE